MDQNGCSSLLVEGNSALAQRVKLNAKQNPGETWTHFACVPCEVTKCDHIRYKECPLKQAGM